MHNEEIKQYIKEELKKIIREITTTGDVAGYLTPIAFRGNKSNNIERLKHIATQMGYELTDKGEKELKIPADKLEVIRKQLAENRYFAYRNDPTHKPHQKLGKAISEINRQLAEINKVIKMNRRLQKEYNIDSSTMWKRTLTGLVKLEAKLIALSQQIREIRN